MRTQSHAHEQVGHVDGPTTYVKADIIGLLSRAQVAKRLGTCSHTVARLTKRGRLPAVVFNRRLIRYAPEAVETLIRSGMTGKGGAS